MQRNVLIGNVANTGRGLKSLFFTASFVAQLSCSCSAKARPTLIHSGQEKVKPLLMLNLALV